jgi:hypothetical protein
LNCLSASGFDANAGFENFARGFAGPNPWKTHLMGNLAKRCIEVAIEFGLIDLDRQFDFVAF